MGLFLATSTWALGRTRTNWQACGLQPCACFLLLGVGQAGSWMCGGPWLGMGQVRLEFWAGAGGWVGRTVAPCA